MPGTMITSNLGGRSLSANPEVSIYLRSPEADKPEYTIRFTLEGERKEYVVPISFDTLREATRLHQIALMRYPVRPVTSSER